jgi:hypothetical protein
MHSSACLSFSFFVHPPGFPIVLGKSFPIGNVLRFAQSVLSGGTPRGRILQIVMQDMQSSQHLVGRGGCGRSGGLVSADRD